MTLKRQHSEEQTSTAVEQPRKRRSEVIRFNFLHACMLCGEECKAEKIKRNPSRWRPVHFCRQVKRKGHKPLVKEEILDKCKERNDTWACEVVVRMGRAVSDLHATDARYQIDCRTKRVIKILKKTTICTRRDAPMSDEGSEVITKVLKADKTYLECS